MKRLRVRKDVIIYHPSPLVLEKDSILRCDFVLFGANTHPHTILNERTHKKIFSDYFEILEGEI